MKQLALILCLVGMFALAGCNDDDLNDFINGNGDVAGDVDNDGNVDDLQAFVLANCNKVSSGDPVPINGATFPGTQETDPAASVYTRRCLAG